MNAFSRRLHVPPIAVMALVLHVSAAPFKFLPELAWGEMRLEEPRHLRQIDTPGSLWGYTSPAGLKVLEQMTFELEPYPKALSKIDDQAHRSVDAILGQERTAHFGNLSPALTGPPRRFLPRYVTR